MIAEDFFKQVLRHQISHYVCCFSLISFIPIGARTLSSLPRSE